jgi:uncharacterized protein YtpQ (UPF0354 family)
VAISDEGPRSWCERARAYIKPALPEAESEDALSLPQDEQPVLRNLGTGLLVASVVDVGGQFRYIQAGHLREAGWSADQLHVHAVENLRAFARENLKLVDYGGTYAVILDGNFEASLLVVDDFWDRIATRQAGPDIAVALPARDVLAFCPAGSSEGLAGLQAIVDRVFPGGDHPISDRLFRRVGTFWTPLDV